MPRAKGVIRIDSDSTHGWQVRVYRHGKTYSRLFSDRKCGGRDEAFVAAVAFRDELEQEVMALPEAEPKRRLIRHNKNNATGVLGISRTFKRDRHGRRHEVYAVSWNPDAGRARGTSFSISKYGDDTAFKMACRLRFQKMKEIHGERFPYASYQELYDEGRGHLDAFANSSQATA
jgi:predicted metalloprotease